MYRPIKTMHLLNIVLQITMCIIQGFYHSHQYFELATCQQIETEKLSIKAAPTYKTNKKTRPSILCVNHQMSRSEQPLSLTMGFAQLSPSLESSSWMRIV